jgi:hypothetical protein
MEGGMDIKLKVSYKAALPDLDRIKSLLDLH